jgi:GNAT superfamily N-acetyltransferase
VLVDSEHPARILGYYSAATLSFKTLTDADHKCLTTYPIPAVRIGRLAEAASAPGQGLGELLLQNAIKRILHVRNSLGVYGVVVEAKDAAAAAFYRRYRFRLCDAHARQLYSHCAPNEVWRRSAARDERRESGIAVGGASQLRARQQKCSLNVPMATSSFPSTCLEGTRAMRVSEFSVRRAAADLCGEST